MKVKTIEEIKEIAQLVRVSENNNEYSINLTEIIGKIKEVYGHNIELRSVDEDDIDELLRFSGNSGEVSMRGEKDFSIVVNPYDSMLRQRFTIAHEIGHILLGHLGENGEDSILEPTISSLNRSEKGNQYDKRETQSNSFAAKLLMPENLVREVFEGIENISMELIEEKAKKFNVSKSALMIRLNFLGFRF